MTLFEILVTAILGSIAIMVYAILAQVRMSERAQMDDMDELIRTEADTRKTLESIDRQLHLIALKMLPLDDPED